MNRKMIFKICLGMLGLVGLGAICALIFKEQLSEMGHWFIDNFGLLGIGIGTIITDTSPIPMTSEPLAVLALASDIPLLQLILVMSIASHLGAPIGYAGGYFLGNRAWFQKIIAKRFPDWQERGQQYAIRLVAMGALLPIPYAITTWFAGSVKADFKKVLLVASFRWVKTVITLLVLAGGWWLGTS